MAKKTAKEPKTITFTGDQLTNIHIPLGRYAPGTIQAELQVKKAPKDQEDEFDEYNFHQIRFGVEKIQEMLAGLEFTATKANVYHYASVTGGAPTPIKRNRARKQELEKLARTIVEGSGLEDVISMAEQLTFNNLLTATDEEIESWGGDIPAKAEKNDFDENGTILVGDEDIETYGTEK